MVTPQEERIQADLHAHLGWRIGELRPIPEGHSGFTYWVDTDHGRAVLRLPPPGARIAGPADIPRQSRIMAALAEQGLPVPRLLASSAQPAIDGRPFVLMEEVPGLRVEAVAAQLSPAALAQAALAVLAQLQAVPLERSGLAQEAPVSVAEEIVYWERLMERAPPELTEAAPRLRRLLERSPPEAAPPVLVHGDFHYGNMLFGDGRVVALLDWEIAQLGQPQLDLSCLCVAAEVGAPGLGAGRWDVPTVGLAEEFGLDPAPFTWFRALTYYKYAAIFGYNLMLHRRGKRVDPTYEERTGTITAFIERGIALLEASPRGRRWPSAGRSSSF
ncbi:MAG TPA: phosphotransferase family protein [Candidatus Dormibacteraeota bacterium]|nr:phosphotransferase family protein [Candidatus Dormibacteraeota bacterium]